MSDNPPTSADSVKDLLHALDVCAFELRMRTDVADSDKSIEHSRYSVDKGEKLRLALSEFSNTNTRRPESTAWPLLYPKVSEIGSRLSRRGATLPKETQNAIRSAINKGEFRLENITSEIDTIEKSIEEADACRSEWERKHCQLSIELARTFTGRLAHLKERLKWDDHCRSFDENHLKDLFGVMQIAKDVTLLYLTHELLVLVDRESRGSR